ncbi:MAG: AraC family transcriptional regulator [Rhodothermales bacterium]|nr:AraC family transcriptional regulator [Rhodothermales bacterium]
MPLTVTTVVGLLGAAQGLVLSAAVVSLRGENRRPNQVLAVVIFILSIVVATVVLEHARVLSCWICLILVEYSFTFLFPPALWYYSDCVLGSRSRVPLAVHFVPAILWFSYLAAYTFGLLDPSWRWIPPILGIIIYLALNTIAIAVRTWVVARKPLVLISHGLMLRVILVLLMLLHVAQIVRFLLNDIAAFDNIVPLTGALIIYIVSFLAFRQSRLFIGKDPKASRQKYETSSLTPDQSQEIVERLGVLMESEKPFLNENLNLAETATRLSVSRAFLSQAVNSQLEISFSEMLNQYRVEEALRLFGLQEYKHLTIEAIGYEVGFRSRSAFHQAFKRIAGETPAQARKRLS